MTLLAIAGLFAQSLANIGRVDLGFQVDSVVMFSIAPETSGYSPEASASLFDRLGEELAAIPGVDSAASSLWPLLSGGGVATGAAADGTEEIGTFVNFISPGFFLTLDIGLLAGRDFTDADIAGAPAVAIVTQRFAERLGLGRDVVGRRIAVFDDVEYEIVGLVADAKYRGVTGEIEPHVFLPRRQSTTRGAAGFFYIRGALPAEDLMAAVRQTVARVDPIVPITNLRSMRQQVRESRATERFVAAASTAFAVLATVLAGLGLYGVLAYAVAQRSREIGLRFALGAPASRIRSMVVRQVAAVAVIGVVLGIAAAWLIGRAVRSLLYGVEAADPLVVAAAAAVLAIVMLGAAYIPARRASRVDPIAVLRHE